MTLIGSHFSMLFSQRGLFEKQELNPKRIVNEFKDAVIEWSVLPTWSLT